MISLIPPQFRLLAAGILLAGAAAAGFAGGYKLRALQATATEASLKADHAQQVTQAVQAGQVKLPAWAVSNGNRGVIEALPASVDAALARLKEFE